METSFLELKQKQVINICDGKQLGRVCDIVFTFPEGKLKGIVVPGGRGFRWGKGEFLIELKQIVKIGVDAVLVELKAEHSREKGSKKWSESPPLPPPAPREGENAFCRGNPNERRDYGEYE